MTKVLNLVTKENSPAYQQQVKGLEQLGVDCTTLSVPSDSQAEDRNLRHYVRFQLQTFLNSTGNFDIVHANYGLTGPAALTQSKSPVVLSLWGSDLMGKYGWLSRWCAKYCDEVIVMSEEMAAELDVSCHVIPHGVNMDLFEPMDQREAQTAIGWNPDVKHVLFPYSPERPVKDYSRAERVVQRVADQHSEPIELKHITGVDHEKIPLYMNAADALLMTSEREGSPNVVKEALACNLPVVSTDVGDVRDRLDAVSLSSVCSSDEELVEELTYVLEHDGRSNGRESVRHLSRRRMSEQIRGVYDQVLRDERTVQSTNQEDVHQKKAIDR